MNEIKGLDEDIIDKFGNISADVEVIVQDCIISNGWYSTQALVTKMTIHPNKTYRQKTLCGVLHAYIEEE